MENRIAPPATVPRPPEAGAGIAPPLRIGAIPWLVVGVLAFGATAVNWGASTNWDWRNYHLYDAWAFLNDRLDTDLAPAQLQTWFNPLLQVPFFLSATHWPLPLHLFVLGLFQGLNGVLLYLLGSRLLPPALQGSGPGMALAAAFAGMTSATVLSQLGTTIGDNLASLAALAALQVALVPAGPSSRSAAVAGLLLGAGTALKMTLAPVAIGAAMAIALAAPRAARLRVGAWLGLGGALGFALFAGWWMWMLWQRFGNPLYPLFGGLFQGPLDPPFAVRDVRFVPDPPWRAWRWPFAPAYDWKIVSDIRFRDLRIPALALGAMLLPWWRRARTLHDPTRELGTALMAGMGIAYAAWLLLFGYHRYLAVVEMLAPLALLLLLGRALPEAPRLRPIAAAILAVLVLATNPPNWGNATRAMSVLDLSLPAAIPVHGALVLLAGEAPTSFLVPAWPDTARFVRVQSNFHGETWPPYGFDRRVAAAIDGHAGPIVVVFASDAAPHADAGLARMGLAREATRCGKIETLLWPANQPPLLLCAVQRSEPASVALERVFARRRAYCARNELPDALWRSVCAAVGD